jgi:hypothetical protein
MSELRAGAVELDMSDLRRVRGLDMSDLRAGFEAWI